MVQVAEFEEKTYEKYFGQELARLARLTYSPGQFAEGDLGFDEAFLLPWLLLHSSPPLERRWWARLPGVGLEEIEHLADQIGSRLPPFRFNLFVQYKRPEWVDHFNGGQWPSWERPYYRYKITPHQQLALERVAEAAGSRASVVYAAPAFWRAKDLFDAAADRRVVAESNCALATVLSGHSKFSYTAAGTHGVAHSEPIRSDGPSIETLLARGWEEPELRFGVHLRKVAQAIEAGLRDDQDGYGRFASARSASLALAGYNEEPPNDSIVYAMATLEGFQDAFSVALYCLSGPSSSELEPA